MLFSLNSPSLSLQIPPPLLLSSSNLPPSLLLQNNDVFFASPSFLHASVAALAVMGEPSAIATTTTITATATPSSGGLSVFLSPETNLPPLNESSELWVRQLVWGDFRVAVAFFVVVPLALLVWAVIERIPPGAEDDEEEDDPRLPIAETVLRLMTSYWQASSLLLLTVALNIRESNLGVFTGLLAQAMIVISLYWWKDLNDEIDVSVAVNGAPKEETSLRVAFSAWRTVAGIAAGCGVVVQAFFQGCNFVPSPLSGDAFCAPWLEPPRFAAGLVGLEDSSGPVALVANIGCALYAAVLLYYATVLLPSVGRNGRAPRPKLMDIATPIGVWIMLGFLDPQQQQTTTTTKQPPPRE